MNILAIETSGMVAGVAMTQDDRVLGEYFLDNKMTHSEILMPMIENILKNTGFNLADIDVFAASVGPGSFTGLRIGISTIKGLAAVVDRPIIAVSTIEGLAYNLEARRGLVCPMIDARRNNVYTGLFDFKDSENKRPEILMDTSILSIDELMSQLKDYDGEIIFNGDGVLAHEERIREDLGRKALVATGNNLVQRASSIALLAYNMAKNKEYTNYRDLEPLYLRKSEAEMKSRRKEKGI